uniref:Uncharacterized protein n=1 Tax=Arundo donax TaxID=35708 RepID=A0A0A9GYK7_ARUDO
MKKRMQTSLCKYLVYFNYLQRSTNIQNNLVQYIFFLSSLLILYDLPFIHFLLSHQRGSSNFKGFQSHLTSHTSF